VAAEDRGHDRGIGRLAGGRAEGLGDLMDRRVVLLLAIGLFSPLPLSNMRVGLAIALIAFAYLEHDGILLAMALAIALALLATLASALWGTIAAVLWLAR
jgi:hypothetical protein